MKKNILLINPPRIDIIPNLDDIYPQMGLNNYDIMENIKPFNSFASQPSGLLKISTHLKSIGHNVYMIDCFPENNRYQYSTFHGTFYRKKQVGKTNTFFDSYLFGMPFDVFEEELKNTITPDEIYITSSMTYHYEGVHKVIDICKYIYPKSKVNLGGIYATLCPEHAKLSKADYIHEGIIKEVDNCHLDFSILNYVPDYAILKSTRGCPNRCSYCAVSYLEGNNVSFRDPNIIIDEIIDKKEKYGITHFVFWESNLLINAKNHFEKILDMIIEEKLDITIDIPEGVQPNLLYQELAVKMHESGISRITVPLESSDADISQNRFNRKTNINHFINCIEMLNKAGFAGNDIIAFILIGLPNQPLDTIVDSFIKAWEMKCMPCVMPFTPIPRTKEYIDNYNLISNKKLDELHPLLFPFVKDNKELELLKILYLCTWVENPIIFFKEVTLKNTVIDLFNEKIKHSDKIIARFA